VLGYGRRSLPAREMEQARARAAEIAVRTLGAAGATLCGQGFLDVASGLYPGVCYRVRPGRRIEIMTPRARRHETAWPWGSHRYLCVIPRYELPAVEFAAQCVLHLTADEAAILRTGNFLPADGPISNVF
jgi:hypothetical protein